MSGLGPAGAAVTRDVWEQVCIQLALHVSRHNLTKWIQPCVFVADDGHTITVRVPTDDVGAYIQRNFKADLDRALAEVGREGASVAFRADDGTHIDVPSAAFAQSGNRKSFTDLPGGGYALTFLDAGVRIEVRRLRRERHQLFGEVDVQCEWAGARSFEGSLSCADLNLSSQSARDACGKRCAARARGNNEFDWVGVIDEVCRRVIKAEGDGTEAIVLDDAPAEGAPRDFEVHGLSIPADSHSQLVTDGGGLKSLLLLLVLGAMARSGMAVAFLDWEWNASRHLGRKLRLFGTERLDSLYYLRCRNSLTVEKDHIRRFCEKHKIQFIALDSIGAACDGKLADDDVARAYNRALDDLPPSLAAAHVPKAAVDPAADLKAFGSAFFHNYARMTWSVKKQIGPSDDIVTVMLVPHKQNDGTRLRSVGLEFTFSPQHIAVRGVDPARVEGLAHALPLNARMMHLLKSGPMTLAAIAQELDAKLPAVTKAVQRGSAFTKLTNTPDGIHRIALVERRIL